MSMKDYIRSIINFHFIIIDKPKFTKLGQTIIDTKDTVKKRSIKSIFFSFENLPLRLSRRGRAGRDSLVPKKAKILADNYICVPNIVTEKKTKYGVVRFLQ